MRALFVNVSERESWIEEFKDERINGVLDLAIHLHLEKYKSYASDVFSERNAVIFGTGNLCYAGANRGVFVFRSPLHGALHASTLGDLGEYIKRAGLNAIVIEGKSDLPIVMGIKNEEVEFLERSEEEVKRSLFENEREFYKELKEFYGDSPFRIALVGVGSRNTLYGCVVSSKLNDISLPDVAGRGGAGSVLLQAHNVVAIAVGGDEKLDIKVERALIQEQKEATKKYREMGTFLANYSNPKLAPITMNWQSILLSKEEREEIRKRFILGELLEGYAFVSSTCGEPCIAACKKIEGETKIDYEPAQALGPFIGIFKREYVKTLIKLVDSLGLDAIYLGYVVAMLFEALYRGYIDSKTLGVKDSPGFDVMNPNSKVNYELAKTLITKLAFGELWKNKRVNEIAGEINAKDLAFYIPFENGYDMTPNFYWSLGLILPVVMHGKYYSDYHTIFVEPEEYARICAKRTVKEYALDNFGVCRFHRGWVEPRLNEIHPNYIETCKQWIGKLLAYKKKANATPRFWESKRVIEVARKLVLELGDDDWKAKVKSGEGLREYWERWKRAYEKSLA